MVVLKLTKLLRILLSLDKMWLRALFFYNVAGSTEHLKILKTLKCDTVIDIGANRGQFALAARLCYPDASIISFEPLHAPAKLFKEIFKNDSKTKLHISAISSNCGKSLIHISARDDSSSLLPISSLQKRIFPGTEEVGTTEIDIGPLTDFVNKNVIVAPALLKLDVQGFELEALRGCESLLPRFDFVYCECSFVELYTGQSLAADVIAWLAEREFHIIGIYNPSYDRLGKAIQADFLFAKNK